MEKERQAPAKQRVAFLAKERTDLALRRTVLASDRTLLAWIRTSLSLMTFGFTIYKFFQYLQESGVAAQGWQPTGPRRFGLTLITLATVLLAAQTWQYYRLLKRLGLSQGKTVPKTATLVAGVVVTLLGVLAFLSIFLHAPFF